MILFCTPSSFENRVFTIVQHCPSLLCVPGLVMDWNIDPWPSQGWIIFWITLWQKTGGIYPQEMLIEKNIHWVYSLCMEK